MQLRYTSPFLTKGITNLFRLGNFFFIFLIFLGWMNVSCGAQSASTHNKHHKTAHKIHPIHAKKSLHHRHCANRQPTTVSHLVPHINENNNVTIPSANFVTAIRQRLVNFVYNSINTLHYSVYKMGGSHFDTSQGIYIVDCSGYVDYSLQAVYPNAYWSLVNSSGADKPNSLHYYDFFTALANDPNKYWDKINDIEQLEPGDILVFRYKHSRRCGHVMVVMNKPVRDGDTYSVSVADSAPSGHSQDTRENTSGVGIGTLLLRANPKTGQPSAFAWKIGSHWEKNVNFAMARPYDVQSHHFPWQTDQDFNS